MVAGRLTRRGMIACGTASVVYPVRAAFAQAAAAAADNPDRTIQGGADASRRVTLPVFIGKRGPYRFVVDTGADRTVIAADLVAGLGLVQSHPVMVQGIARAVSAGSVSVDGLSFGPVTMDRFEAPILPRDWLGVDGYLGLDAVDGYRVVYDFRDRSLTVTETAPHMPYSTPRPNEAMVRAVGHFGRLRSVDCRVDGIQTMAFVDSGADVSVGNRPLLSKLIERGAANLMQGTIELSGVTGGAIPAPVAFISRMELGDLEISGMAIAIADLEIFDIWGLSERPAMLIGMNLLRQFSEITVDYGRKEYHFRLSDMMLAGLRLG